MGGATKQATGDATLATAVASTYSWAEMRPYIIISNKHATETILVKFHPSTASAAAAGNWDVFIPAGTCREFPVATREVSLLQSSGSGMTFGTDFNVVGW